MEGRLVEWLIGKWITLPGACHLTTLLLARFVNPPTICFETVHALLLNIAVVRREEQGLASKQLHLPSDNIQHASPNCHLFNWGLLLAVLKKFSPKLHI